MTHHVRVIKTIECKKLIYWSHIGKAFNMHSLRDTPFLYSIFAPLIVGVDVYVIAIAVVIVIFNIINLEKTTKKRM